MNFEAEKHGGEENNIMEELSRTPEDELTSLEQSEKSEKDAAGETEFDAAEALVVDTLAEAYDKEVARMLGVKDGQTPEEVLDPIEMKIYQAHLDDRDDNIKAVVARLKNRVKQENRDLSELNKDEITEELDQDLFGGN